jgi:hypothetical protein
VKYLVKCVIINNNKVAELTYWSLHAEDGWVYLEAWNHQQRVDVLGSLRTSFCGVLGCFWLNWSYSWFRQFTSFIIICFFVLFCLSSFLFRRNNGGDGGERDPLMFGSLLRRCHGSLKSAKAKVG